MDNLLEPKIISLLPAATEFIAALGLTKYLVGRSHECDYPPEVQNLPICTTARLNSHKSSGEIDRDVKELVKKALSIYEVNADAIAQIKPTHIVTQDQCDVCAVSLGEVERALKELTQIEAQIISLQPNRLSEVWEDIERLGKIFKIPIQNTLTKLQLKVELCQKTVQSLALKNLPTVVALEWTEPMMGAGNWIPELIELAGGKPLFGETGKHSPYLKWEELQQADPDVMIVMPCGFDLERTRQESQVLKQHSGWNELKAVKGDRVYVTDGNAYFNRPGPRLVDSLEILAEILHPSVLEFGYIGTGWDYF
ncbi:MAG: cobalamin-binding protein [Cyanobacteria bacterium SBLK]|nr:cobalamin-binding protein [Cyanobacteria bacterium SBLK]